MDEKVESIFQLAGNSNYYQYRLSILTFLIWINVNTLSISVGFLEKSPDIKYYDTRSHEYIDTSLNSTICQWDNNYTITKNYTHSIVTSYGYDCDPLWIGIFGSSIFTGDLIGSFIFQYLIEKFGRKRTFVLNAIPYLLSLLAICFTPNYISIVVFIFFSELFSENIIFSTYLISTEITSSESRSIFGSFINSATGVCGILYSVYYKYIGNWRYCFLVCFGSNLIFFVLFFIYSFESPRFYLIKKDFENFIETLRKIAKVNNKLELFDKMIKEENSSYKDIYEFLKEITIKPNKEKNKQNEKVVLDDQANIQIKDKPHNESLKNMKEEPIQKKSFQTSSNGHNTDLLIKKTNNKAKIGNKETFIDLDGNDSSIDLNINSNFNNIKNKNFSVLDLFRYASIRYKFLSLCFIWLTASGSYYGLSINIKNLSGDLYYNGIINYAFEIMSYYFTGYLINRKFFGRKNTLCIFYFISIIGLILYIFYKFDDAVTNFILFIVRLCIASNYIILFTYTLEIYPSPARARGFGINNAVCKFTPVIFPILIEIIPKVIFYIYLLMNLCCFLLLIVFLPETLGKPLKELIEEEENLFISQYNSFIKDDKKEPLIDPLTSF